MIYESNYTSRSYTRGHSTLQISYMPSEKSVFRPHPDAQVDCLYLPENINNLTPTFITAPPVISTRVHLLYMDLQAPKHSPVHGLCYQREARHVSRSGYFCQPDLLKTDCTLFCRMQTLLVANMTHMYRSLAVVRFSGLVT